VLNGQPHIGHIPDAISGQSMRDDFGAGNASANRRDSLYDPGAYGDCLSQAQVGLCFSSFEVSTSQPSRISQGAAFGITINVSNDKLLQVSDDFLCD